MIGIGSLLFLSAVCSPHHMGPGMGLHDGVDLYEDRDNITLESFNNTDDSTDPVDFSLPIGFGASFGILGFIISILALKQNNNRDGNIDGNIDGNLNENSIYLEPEVNDTISLNRDTLVTNNGYESEIIIIDEIYEQMD